MLTAQLKLCANPFADTPSLAQAMTMPLHTERDFASMAELPTGDVAILLNHAEHYRLIDGLLQTCWQVLPELHMLLRMQMPAGGRMPRSFLDERVLMVQHVGDEESRWQPALGPLLVIDDHLPRYPLEAGDNRLQLRLHAAEGTQLAALLDSAIDYLCNHAFELESKAQ